MSGLLHMVSEDKEPVTEETHPSRDLKEARSRDDYIGSVSNV